MSAASAVPAPEPPPSIDLAGWNRNFYIRDPSDTFRLYPMGQLNIDFYSFFGPGVYSGGAEGEPGLLASDGGTLLMPKLFLRRVRIELAGDITKYVQWLAITDVGGQPMSNTSGTTQTSASSAGLDPTADSARFAAVQAPAASIQPIDSWVNVRFMPELNLMIGQEKTPVSLENRTSNSTTVFMERNVATRGFVVPTQREIGLTVWGDVGTNSVLAYEVGVYLGDGMNRGQVDDKFDGIGRMFVRPFAARERHPVQGLQLGVSGRYGQRNPLYVGYDVSPITTNQGWQLWSTTYKDSLSRTVHILPSGGQGVFGGELRAPFMSSRVAVQAEAYYVSSETREAIDGYQLTNTERLGALKGVGWYVQINGWPFGEPAYGDPGFVRPVKIEFDKRPKKPELALELAAVAAGVNATYDGAARDGGYDEKTPGSPTTASDIDILQLGLGANLWFSRNFRVMVNYMIYSTPGSDEGANLAVVPGNEVTTPIDGATWLHELGSRIAVVF